MTTNLKHAIDMAERLQHICAATTGKLETLDVVIAEMKLHENKINSLKTLCEPLYLNDTVMVCDILKIINME